MWLGDSRTDVERVGARSGDGDAKDGVELERWRLGRKVLEEANVRQRRGRCRSFL